MASQTSNRNLNKEQLEAVPYSGGPLLIVAGAGTGKTTVITERIKHLISEKKIKPSDILALTFTEKAAREMEDRIDAALPYGYTQLWVSTFHAFCDAILRDEALHIGLDPKFKLLTSVDVIDLVRKNIFNFELDYFRPLGNPTKFISGLLQHFSRLQDEDITPDDYLDWVKKQKPGDTQEENLEYKKWKELADAYKKYDELKIKYGYLDYGDLITKTLWLFRQRVNVLKKYQDKFKYILVDEFQDTNIAQYNLLKLMSNSNPNPNLTIVGDDSQSIYKFRGAAISNIIQFKDDYKNTKTVILTKNYRSTQSILDASYNLIQYNNPDTLESKLGISKQLVSQVKYAETEIEFIHTDKVDNEVDSVIEKIKGLVGEGYEYKDIAILVRANNHADPFVKGFNYAGIPNQFLGPGKLFKEPEIIDLISYLKIVNDLSDSISLYRLLSSEFVNIDAEDLMSLSISTKKDNLTYFEACKRVENLTVSEQTKSTITKLIKLIKVHLDQAKRESGGKILYNFLEEFAILPKLVNPSNEIMQKQATNIANFFQKLKTYEITKEQTTVADIVDWIDLSLELGESPLTVDADWTQENAVNILTVHGSKGLEFPIVFLVNLVAQRFPTTERKEQIPIPEGLIKELLPSGDYHLQEERRLAYVGMTRAKERLFLTASDYYGDAKRIKKISPFVGEALDGKLDLNNVKMKAPAPFQIENSPPIKQSKKNKLEVSYLSYSQIETFKICPLHYKLNYILKLPTPPSASQSFGISIHGALKSFYESVKAGKKPTEKLLIDSLSNNWVKEGYLSKDHEKKFFEKGKLYLTGYYKQEFNPQLLPVLMEEKFTLPLDSAKPLKIGGVIDRVDQLSDGTIEIIDYKTSANIPTQKDVDKNLQLAFYALAASTIPQAPFGKDTKDIKLSLYFFDTQEKFTTIRTKQDLQRAVDEILQVRDEIEASDFECTNSFLCQNCEFKMFCNSN